MVSPAHQLLARLVAWGDAPVNRELDCIISDARALLAAGEEAGWISVEERLPPSGVNILAHWWQGDMTKAHYHDGSGGDWWYFHSTGLRRALVTPTHWMPLPAPPAHRERQEGAEPDPDLTVCPKCGGDADQGHDRCIPPSPYLCSKCDRLLERLKKRGER